MAHFLKNGTSWRVSSKEALNLHDQLPAGNYTVATDPFGNFYLEQILYEFGFKYEFFIEPDLNGGEMTAIAVHPVDEDKRDILLAFNLLKF